MHRNTRTLYSHNRLLPSVIISSLGAVTVTCSLIPTLVCAQSPIAGRLSNISGLTPAERNTAVVIEDICPPQNLLDADLQTRCNRLVGVAGNGTAGQDEARTTLQQVAPSQIATQGTYAVEVDSSQFDNLLARIAALRTGLTGISLSDLSFTIDGKTFSGEQLKGGGASPDQSGVLGKLGLFINGIGTLGNREQTGNTPGFDFDSAGLTAGADYRFTDNFILGAAFGYAGLNTEFNNNAGKIDLNQYAISAYGTYYLPDGFYVDGLFSFAWNDFESTRNFDYGFTVGGQLERVVTEAKSNPDSTQFSISGGGGYEFARGPLSLTPYVRVNFIRTDIDGFTESRADGWGTRYDDQKIDSLTTQLGGQAGYAVSTQWGVLSPQLIAEWLHEFKNDARSIPVRFIGDHTGTVFIVPTDKPDRDFFNLGAGVSATFARGVSAFFYYEALLGYKDLERNLFTGGIRYEF